MPCGGCRPSTDGVLRRRWAEDHGYRCPQGARERLALVVSSDLYNSTDFPIVIVAEVVEEALLRDSPLAVRIGGYVVMPDRISSPMKKWFTECVDVADTDTMLRVGRALRILQQL